MDRLEPAFRIAPLARSLPPAEPTCDIVVIRPLRDPSISKDSEEARSAFSAKVWQIFAAVYQDGAHVQLAYTTDGNLSADTDGPSVVEYLRCSGWEWTPVRPVLLLFSHKLISTFRIPTMLMLILCA